MKLTVFEFFLIGLQLISLSKAEFDQSVDFGLINDDINNVNISEVEQLFEEFQARYNRHYKSIEEYQRRLKIFEANLEKIKELNRNEQGSAIYAVNEFADLSSDEFKTGYASFKPRTTEPQATKLSFNPFSNSGFPEKFDWRERGYVTKIKHQGYLCGTCWAHAAVGNIESLYAIQTGKLEEFSEQQLEDCDKSNNACLGGYPIKAYQAIKEMGGLASAADYPYVAKNQTCYFNTNMTAIKIKDHILLPKNETIMQKWLVAMGPISIGINFTPWQFYSRGVIQMDAKRCTPYKLDHAALIVGYGWERTRTWQRRPYWIVKNSYGTDWGEEGYARIYRGANVCGIGEEPTSAVLED